MTNDSQRIDHIRRDFKKSSLNRENLESDPYMQFGKWFEEALSFYGEDSTAFILSTASGEGIPSSRVVLLKFHSEQGYIFFTNYNSHKGRDINQNPNVSMLFFWPELERQIRIEGKVRKTSEDISDEYFYSRPFESRLAAKISRQSEPVDEYVNLKEDYEFALTTCCPADVKRPAHWGGYLITPLCYEFWQGRPGRMHDRFKFEQTDKGVWKITQLQP